MTVANQEQLELLKQGVEVWNRWRRENREIEVDLVEADLTGVSLVGVDFVGADLIGIRPTGLNLSRANLACSFLINTDLHYANLHRANLCRAHLWAADLYEADLSHANLRNAELDDTNLREANLWKADLSNADLSNAKLWDANLQGVDLSGATLWNADLWNADLSGAALSSAALIKTRSLATNFTGVNFTGACLEDWNINSETKLDGVICEYVYLRQNQQERRPSSGSFQPGEFTALFQKALETVDLIFTDGIDWQAFFQSFQELRSHYDEKLSIQAIEKKSGGAFVIRLEVPAEANKGEVEGQAKERYQHKLQLLETQYRAELHAKDREIEIYKQQSTDMLEIVKLQASRPINPIAIAGSQTMGDRKIHMGSGNYNERIEGPYIQGNYINMSQDLTQAAQQIQDLLRQLQNQGATVEDSQKQVATQMAKQAETDPSMMGKLVLWSKAMANKASETTVSEAAKIVLTLALKAAGLPSP